MFWIWKCCDDCDKNKRQQRKEAFERTVSDHEKARYTLKEKKEKLKAYLDNLNGGSRPHFVRTVRKGHH